MPRVHLLGELRRQCAGHKTVDIDAQTVVGLIAELESRFPDVRGAGLSHMSVAIDGEIMTNADYVEVAPEAEVHFVPAISGG